MGNVPGAGLLRDSQKFVLPYALLLTLCVALGVERLAHRLGGEPGRVLLGGMLVVIVGVMPDLAFGGAGAMKPVSYPADWAKVDALIERSPARSCPCPCPSIAATRGTTAASCSTPRPAICRHRCSPTTPSWSTTG